LTNRTLYRSGTVWFYDFLVIVLECTVLIFLGGNSSPEANRIARIDFVQLLVLLYSVDVLWIISQWIMSKVASSWHRDRIPLGWCSLNAALIVGTILVHIGMNGTYSNLGYTLLLAMNIGAFVIDVLLMDHYQLV
jgi:hypothetical protein